MEPTGFATYHPVDIEAATQEKLGELVDWAHHHGVTTHLTRDGKVVAAIVPVDRVEYLPSRRGTARWDQDKIITVTATTYIPPGEPRTVTIDYDRGANGGYIEHAISRQGWNLTNPDDFLRFHGGETVPVVRLPDPRGQAEQLAEWIARYGDRRVVVSSVQGRIRYLLSGEEVKLEGDSVILETRDPNGQLFARASWPGVGNTLAEVINGTQRPPQRDDWNPWQPETGAGQ